ncbi:MAG: hypothetical protein M1828_000249 [Chrysothrix sp. TS-e1954]|nr:MAG: hypothetical protein M1828_000249 [Chrysothrix sp. TS-e1954]
MAAVSGMQPTEVRKPRPVRQAIDESSTIFPDRPIRPLPKRPIKSRLSEDFAEKIVYPPALPSSSPNFGSPSSQSGVYVDAPYYTSRTSPFHQTPPRNPDSYEYPPESDDEPDNSHPSLRTSHRAVQAMVRPSRTKPHPQHSANSSIDGYESFENTNNKKKRKIPITGTTVNGLPLDVASNSNLLHAKGVLASAERPVGAGAGQYYGSGSVAGAQAGAMSNGTAKPYNEKSSRRMMNDRRTGTNSATALTDSINGLSLDDELLPPSNATNIKPSAASKPEEQHNLNAFRRNVQASPGQQAEEKEFTFECKSNSSSKFARSAKMSQEMSKSMNPSALARNNGAPSQFPRNTAADMRNDPSSASPNPASYGQNLPPAQDSQHATSQQPGGAAADKKTKPRKPSNRDLTQQARQRKAEQEYSNYRGHGTGATWVCEFCEYESIFGEPPLALIRQYELKDRTKREEQKERARLLEKAKAKGRKTKKGPKGNAKNNVAPPPSAEPSAADQYDPRYPSGGLESPEDEYYDDHYYEEGVDVPGGPDGAIDV